MALLLYGVSQTQKAVAVEPYAALHLPVDTTMPAAVDGAVLGLTGTF
ncbi:MAG: hypothetical protein PHU25_22165 [Deltaproteobacteria bacterium]|nr:hypothetical protein [Deltaproteobacteria bacterium]